MERRVRLQRKTPLQPRRSGGLTSRTPPLPRGKPLRKRSDKRAQQMSLYRPLARAFLETHPRCQFPLGCTAPSTEVHHRRGREGARLLDERFWAASCRACNEYAEEHTGDALACGWLLPANDVAAG